MARHDQASVAAVTECPTCHAGPGRACFVGSHGPGIHREREQLYQRLPKKRLVVEVAVPYSAVETEPLSGEILSRLAGMCVGYGWAVSIKSVKPKEEA